MSVVKSETNLTIVLTKRKDILAIKQSTGVHGERPDTVLVEYDKIPELIRQLQEIEKDRTRTKLLDMSNYEIESLTSADWESIPEEERREAVSTLLTNIQATHNELVALIRPENETE